jgi:hypothetical protein
MNVPANSTQNALGKARKSSSKGAGDARGCSTMTGEKGTRSPALSAESARTESGKAPELPGREK